MFSLCAVQPRVDWIHVTLKIDLLAGSAESLQDAYGYEHRCTRCSLTFIRYSKVGNESKLKPLRTLRTHIFGAKAPVTISCSTGTQLTQRTYKKCQFFSTETGLSNVQTSLPEMDADFSACDSEKSQLKCNERVITNHGRQLDQARFTENICGLGILRIVQVAFFQQ